MDEDNCIVETFDKCKNDIDNNNNIININTQRDSLQMNDTD